MGYTHNWDKSDTAEDVWAALVADARRIAETAGVPLAGPMGDGEPQFNAERIALNGVEATGDDYESFVLVSGATTFEFCKTGRMPYDVVVTAILLRAAHTVPGFDVRSDGGWGSDWVEARKLYATVFGEEPDKPAKLRNDD